ncbi:hypothetical protein K1719_023479 [Acacia pycnantha]|nr:hypothetical protein K1719_023479 [Acacia pycnantha]
MGGDREHDRLLQGDGLPTISNSPKRIGSEGGEPEEYSFRSLKFVLASKTSTVSVWISEIHSGERGSKHSRVFPANSLRKKFSICNCSSQGFAFQLIELQLHYMMACFNSKLSSVFEDH